VQRDIYLSQPTPKKLRIYCLFKRSSFFQSDLSDLLLWLTSSVSSFLVDKQNGVMKN